jgi:hypothetical protein
LPALALVLVPVLASAGPPRHYPAPPPARPAFVLNLSAGQFEPEGDSELWSENEDLYGLDPSDLQDWVLGVEFGKILGPHLEVLLGAEYYSSENASYRFTDTEGYPIALSHRLRMAPVTAGLKWMPFGRVGPTGRHRRLVPYLSGGLGAVFWDYEEVGDFIDPYTDEVYSGRADADGAALGLYLAVGLEIPLSPFWSVYLEGRHQSAQDDLGNLFAGYDELDLSGDSIAVGASFRF